MNEKYKTVLKTEEARQGNSSGVIWVLAISGIGAIFALAAVYMFV